MSNTQTAVAVRDDMPLERLGELLAKSGYFKDSQQAGQAVVKVLAGRELGFGPIASMTGINIIQGKIGIGANLLAAAVRRNGRYDYRVLSMTDKVCELEFFEIVNGKRESIGKSSFTAEDAAKAGTQNMNKFPRNMLFARAISNGVKWYCPDVTGGPVYTPEDLGATVNEDGEIIDALPSKPAPVVNDYRPTANGAISTPGGIVSAPITNGNGHKSDTWARIVATLRPKVEDSLLVRNTYDTLTAIVTKANEGVLPYETKPASIADAIARCRDMAPIADKAQQEAAQ